MAETTDFRAVVYKRLTDVFRDVFDNRGLELSDTTTAKDVKHWDSLNHITLLVAVERCFKIRFNSAEMARLANVGELVDVVVKKLSARPGGF